MLTIRKDPFRHIRYIMLLFFWEFIRGDEAKRRRFVSRIVYRTAPGLGVYAVFTFLFMAFHAWRCILLPPDARARAWRYRRWLRATFNLENRDYLRSWITDRYASGPKIVVIGMGTIGDILQITPVLKTLREKMPTAHICLLHRSAIAETVLQGNPHINSVSHADFFQFSQIKRAVQTEGAADMALEIQSVSYIVTTVRAPKALRHPDFDRLMPEDIFAQSESFRALWQKDLPPLPRAGENFAWPENWRACQFLDILGKTSGLPIDRDAMLDFYTNSADEGVLKQLPVGRPVVTIQNGADTDVVKWSRATGRRATKLLPLETWKPIVKLLGESGFAVIQLGTDEDEAVEGVATDLRGKTTLREAAVVLSHASCHVGTEGGLAHLARAMNTLSVVMFGPTSAFFHGYAQNINLAASGCSACCWSCRDWFLYCPRGLAEPECMTGHQAETVVEAVMKLASTTGRPKIREPGSKGRNYREGARWRLSTTGGASSAEAWKW
jgi:ADP-heptose:LPS heptosyltransferase